MPLEQLGPYKIGRQLGRGGMGAVYAAVHVETQQPAAVKVLIQHLATHSGFRERFMAEIESLKRLDHPNIVKLYGFGEQDDVLFYAMELVQGKSLEDLLRTGRRFLWPEVLQFGVDITKALKNAHDNGIIHRDIKPANILLSDSGLIKLSDFGIARLFGNTGMTSDGSLLGTAEYMAPEQAEGRPVTPSCDLYSLGGVLYTLLANRPPFRSKSLPEMLQMQRFTRPEPLSSFAPQVPAELEKVVMRLLEKDPQARFHDATMLLRNLIALPELVSEAEQAAARAQEKQDKSSYPVAASSTHQGLDVTAAMSGSSADANAPTRAADEELKLAPAAEKTVAANPSAARKSGNPEKDEAALGASAAGQGSLHGRTTVARFTQVDERVRKATRAPAAPVPFFTWQTIVLVVALLGLLGGAWFYTRPPSADTLFNRIQEYAADGDPDHLVDAEDDIHQFLEKHPQDARREKVEHYASDLELQRARKRFQLRVARQGGTLGLLPIERDYAAAMEWATRSPETAIKKLQALVALYDPPLADAKATTVTNESTICLQLARQQLKRLETELSAVIQKTGPWLDTQLKTAESLRDKNPAAVRTICQAIVDLYGDQAWASERVERAKQQLKDLGGK